jgi:hypothetical protein
MSTLLRDDRTAPPTTDDDLVLIDLPSTPGRDVAGLAVWCRCRAATGIDPQRSGPARRGA